MVKVGIVYKSDGTLDLSTLPWMIKLKIFTHHMIDNSLLLSGNRSKMLNLKEEEGRRKVHDYTVAFLYYLEQSSFRNQSALPMTYNIDDDEFVKLALGGPSFFEYGKEFVAMEHNLSELQAYKSGIVILRRLRL